MELNENHWRIPRFRQRMKAKEWQKILLDGADDIVYKGNCVKLKADTLGYGVVEIYKDIPENNPNKEYN